MSEYDENIARRLGADDLSSGEQLRAYYDALNRYIMAYGYKCGAFSGPDTIFFLSGQDSEDVSIRTNPLTQFNLKVEYPWELARMLREETHEEIRDNLRDKRADLVRYKEAFSYWLDYLAAHNVHVNISKEDSFDAVADKINQAVYDTKVKERKLEEVKEQQAKQRNSNVKGEPDAVKVNERAVAEQVDVNVGAGIVGSVVVASVMRAKTAESETAILDKKLSNERIPWADDPRVKALSGRGGNGPMSIRKALSKVNEEVHSNQNKTLSSAFIRAYQEYRDRQSDTGHVNYSQSLDV